MSSTSRRRNVLTGAFVLFTIVLGVVAGIGIVNYYQFFPALAHIRVEMTSLQWTPLNTTMGPTLETSVAFRVQNPTGYKGLFAENFESSLDILSTARNVTIPQGSIPSARTAGPLNPGDVIRVQFNTFNTTSDAAILASQTQVTFVFTVRFVVSSFLDNMGLLLVSYQCASPGGPVACSQDSVTIVTRAGGSGGGGGGCGGYVCG